MVVLSRDTGFAETTMLAPCRLEELTCLTLIPGVEDDTIIGVPSHLLCMVLWGDIRRGDHTCVQEDIRDDYRRRNANPVDSGNSRPCYREKHELPCSKQGHEENLPASVLATRQARNQYVSIPFGILTRTTGWFSFQI